jgi:hypothetical protein
MTGVEGGTGLTDGTGGMSMSLLVQCCYKLLDHTNCLLWIVSLTNWWGEMMPAYKPLPTTMPAPPHSAS